MTLHELSLHAGQAAFALLIVTGLIWRQLRSRPVHDRTWILPIVLIVLALQPPGPSEASAAGVVILGISLVFAAVMGVLRASTMLVWRNAKDESWCRGTSHTALLWFVTVVVRIGLEFGVGSLLGVSPHSGGIWLGLATTLGIQRVVLVYRAKMIAPPSGPVISSPAAGHAGALS